MGCDAITHVLSGGRRGGTDTENREYVRTEQLPAVRVRSHAPRNAAPEAGKGLSIPWFQPSGTASRLLAPRTMNDKSVLF